MRTNATSLAIAFLLLASTLVVTPTLAQSSNTDMVVRASPFFDNTEDSCALVYARPQPADASDPLIQRRGVRILTSTGPYEKIVFSYALTADPGSNIAPGMSRALKWDLGNSGADGWNVQVDNSADKPGGVRTLTFRDGRMEAGTPRDFRIAFNIPSNAIGDSPNPALADRYPISITATYRSGSSDTTGDPTSLCIKIDNTPPKLERAVTRDADENGFLDQMQLKFSEPIDPATVVKDEFAVRTLKPIRGEPDKNAYALFDPILPNSLTQDRLTLRMASSIRYDTGNVPDVVFPASLDRPDRLGTRTLADLAGNAMQEVTPEMVPEFDGAKPVLVSAFGPVRATEILLTFSEPVYGEGGNVAVKPEDLRYLNTAPVQDDFVKTPLDPETQLDALKHAPGPDTGHQVTIFLKSPVEVGAGDYDKTFEGWLLRDSDNQPAECDTDGPVWEPSPNANTCGKRVHDATGLTALPIGTLPVKNTSPLVRTSGGAEINIGTTRLALSFNGPVSGATDTQAIDIKALDIVSADGTGQGPGGIVALEHEPGGRLVLLTLDKPARPTDVDDSPARVRVRCDLNGNSAIKGTGVNAFVPCFDPNGDGAVDVPMVDQTVPNIYEAKTYDGDRDGYLDGFQFIFTEPVDDASFCMGPVANMPAPLSCDPDCSPPATPPPSGRPACGNSIEIEGVPGPYTWDTDLRPNDDQGILRFNEIPTMTSAAKPEITTTGSGMFADLARPPTPGSPLPYTAANKMPRLCHTTVGDIGCNYVTELDGAPPVIWRASTVDTPIFLPGQPNTTKAEGNGWIDGYRLVFSEPVDDATFHKEEWSVAGHSVLQFRSYDRGEEDRQDIERLINDATLTLLFNETRPKQAPDTAARPDLTYRNVLGGLKDQRGNAMRTVQSIDVDEQDGAPPTIVRIETPHPIKDPSKPDLTFYTTALGVPSRLTIHFSEPVDDGNLGPIIRSNFVYGNTFRPATEKDPGGVSGMKDQGAVEHKAGESVAYVTLNGVLTDFDVFGGIGTQPGGETVDLAPDCLGTNAAAVFEVAPTVPIKQAVGVTCRELDFGNDQEPPGPITELAVTQAVTTANSVTLTWKAPGDDGMTHGPVQGYLVKVSKQEINETNFDVSAVEGDVLATTAATLSQTSPRLVSAGGLVFEFSPDIGGLAQPGSTQSMTVTGLSPDTPYYFALKAFDGAEPAHFSPRSDVVEATTGQDFTPPAPAPVISSTSHGANRPTSAPNAVFQWTESRDPEGAPVYCYALNKDPSYTINPKKDSTCAKSLSQAFPGLAKGTHVFHVAAVSGGGQTATAHYTIVIGATRIDPKDIATANELLRETMRVERLDGVNTVSWELPPVDQLPRGANVAAVRILRFEDGKAVLLLEKAGDYETLRTGSYTDNSTEANERSAYRVDMVFADGQVQPDSITGFRKVVDVTPTEDNLMPFLVTLAIAVVAFALAWVGIALTRRNAGAPVESVPAGVDAETGLPTHDVRCPSCQTAFQAVGNLPLQIGCPRCGVTGLLN